MVHRACNRLLNAMIPAIPLISDSFAIEVAGRLAFTPKRKIAMLLHKNARKSARQSGVGLQLRGCTVTCIKTVECAGKA